MVDKPAIVTEEHLTFLDELSKRITSMFYSANILRWKFHVTASESDAILGYWMNASVTENTPDDIFP
jgi:hypothetical protein